jgi:hypothetical protein
LGLLIHPAAGVFYFKGVTEGLVMEAEKRKKNNKKTIR